MSFTELIKERQALNGCVAPVNTNGQLNTGTVDMSLYGRVQFIVIVKDSGGNVNACIQQGNNANGSDAANTTVYTTTLLNTANQFSTLELQYGSPELTGRYVRCTAVSTAATNIGFVGEAFDPRYHPIGTNDSSVNQRLAG